MPADPVAIARALIRCRSVTPDEGGALAYLQDLLARAGFQVHRAIFAEPGTAPVDNLYARIGTARPNLVFAGHTDVVPPGNESAWSHPPFAGEIVGDRLYGRGAVDMKGGIACFVAAALDYLGARGSKPNGSISLLITGDEESVAVNGTVKLLRWAAERGESFDHCILGEPSNVDVLGDTIKAGRRGSLNGTLIVTGRQGHVAYPERADNPIHGLVTLIAALQAPLDEGSEHFVPSHLEFTSVDVGNATVNLIPGEARARFNIRYNDRHSQTALKTLIERRTKAAAAGRVRYAFEWQPSNADVFITKPGPFTELAASAIAEVTGHRPKLSTSGGTSDARFIKDYCPVLEFGLVGRSMHQTDESTPLEDLHTLTAIYRRIIERYFG
ncbi:MAG TPA: succinyl-diaminopimelate desuccinylase [Xanthobacteraceae bacterium]|jgi:succinyl-diaminopimelate desuccinylase|nr:succinyl-diaminopimelate desuccinylase [Xanthobacteraceae bacterium]HYQ05755.1 succinyl-diaminopimelate desuccinylase [Xanthobacteraceae bacterium]